MLHLHPYTPLSSFPSFLPSMHPSHLTTTSKERLLLKSVLGSQKVSGGEEERATAVSVCPADTGRRKQVLPPFCSLSPPFLAHSYSHPSIIFNHVHILVLRIHFLQHQLVCYIHFCLVTVQFVYRRLTCL